METLQTINYAKEILDEYAKQYVWVPLRYKKIDVEYNGVLFSLTESGFQCLDKGIGYTFSEMSDVQASICVRLLPEFSASINQIIGM